MKLAVHNVVTHVCEFRPPAALTHSSAPRAQKRPGPAVGPEFKPPDPGHDTARTRHAAPSGPRRSRIHTGSCGARVHPHMAPAAGPLHERPADEQPAPRGPRPNSPLHERPAAEQPAPRGPRPNSPLREARVGSGEEADHSRPGRDRHPAVDGRAAQARPGAGCEGGAELRGDPETPLGSPQDPAVKKPPTASPSPIEPPQTRLRGPHRSASAVRAARRPPLAVRRPRPAQVRALRARRPNNGQSHGRARPTAHVPLRTSHCAPPTAHLPLRTSHCAPPTAHLPLRTSHCAPPTAHLPLRTSHCAPPTAHLPLRTSHCAPPRTHTTNCPPPTAHLPLRKSA
ncbi:uncharacterized protein [Dipodomys merriami]|uniref:uncharacterized protein n=1 Tax=Dipodomys merriami TaxID=94247 RepID=UPI0038557481